MNIFLLVAAILGLSSVVLGSFGEHGLRPKLDEELYRNFMTALRYHQNYSIILLILALAQYLDLGQSLLSKLAIAFWIFLFATVTFSAAVYIYVLTGSKAVSFLAPVGGISLMLSWLFLIYIAIAK